MELPKLGKPIGIALLPKSKKMVIGITFLDFDHVKIFSREGMFMKRNDPYFHMGYTTKIQPRPLLFLLSFPIRARGHTQTNYRLIH